MIALLTIGLVFSLNFLYHSAITTSVDLMNVVITQPAVAQVSSSPNSDVPADSEAKPAQDSRWIWWVIGFCFTFCFIHALCDSWCPVCERFWLVETTTRVIREATEQTEGVEEITRRCTCCEYTQELWRTIPRVSDSCAGCGCGI